MTSIFSAAFEVYMNYFCVMLRLSVQAKKVGEKRVVVFDLLSLGDMKSLAPRRPIHNGLVLLLDLKLYSTFEILNPR